MRNLENEPMHKEEEGTVKENLFESVYSTGMTEEMK